jgi:hypothetical protein
MKSALIFVVNLTICSKDFTYGGRRKQRERNINIERALNTSEQAKFIILGCEGGNNAWGCLLDGMVFLKADTCTKSLNVSLYNIALSRHVTVTVKRHELYSIIFVTCVLFSSFTGLI